MAKPDWMVDLCEELRDAPEPPDLCFTLQIIRDEFVKRGFDFRYFDGCVIFDNRTPFGAKHRAIWIEVDDGIVVASAYPGMPTINVDLRNPQSDLIEFVEKSIVAYQDFVNGH